MLHFASQSVPVSDLSVSTLKKLVRLIKFKGKGSVCVLLHAVCSWTLELSFHIMTPSVSHHGQITALNNAAVHARTISFVFL